MKDKPDERPIDYEANRIANQKAGRTCMCDGGGSIMHVPSPSCTVFRPTKPVD